jgi:ATP-binding cassette subfamily B protein
LPAGAVKVGGVDVLDVSLEATRRSIGYSPQDPFLFSRTIAENVAFGLDDPTAPDAGERIRAACRAAHVESDILSFREGYETVVGERGVQLSGGQKQRIALARALVGDHDILVLDDPMSAVDASTERGILDAIDQASGTRTLILVTHRCSAARHADRIAVLEEGRVVEEGTHEELVGRDGLYASFWAQQQLEAELDTIGATGRATETES